MSNKKNKTKEIPIFDYNTKGGDQIKSTELPDGTKFAWINSLGGQSLDAPLQKGELRPDGKPAHGGVYANDTVYYHGG